jgi:hypothetical protein
MSSLKYTKFKRCREQRINWKKRTRIKAEKRFVYRKKREKRKTHHLRRLEKLYILNPSKNCLCATVTPDQNIEIAIEPIVHRTTATNALERRIAILVRRLRKRNTETVGINKVELQTASGAVVGKTRGEVEDKTH